MKTTIAAPFLALGILFSGLSTSCLAVDIPERVDINLQTSNPILKATNKDSKSVPGFSHATHATIYLKNFSAQAGRTYDEQFICKACHAGAESVKDIGGEAAKQKQVDEVNGAGGVKKYMHALCLDCHKNLKKMGIATGPTSCKGCHNPR